MPVEPLAEPEFFPPVVRCTQCGALDCQSCSFTAPPPAVGTLAWEVPVGSTFSRLWSTALTCSTEPALAFGQLRSGSVLSAFSFALLAEILAIASIGVTLLPFAWLLFPELMWGALQDAWVWALCLGALLTASALMLLLHAMWGACIEWGALRAGEVPDLRLGLRFALYGCGWDLLTSPFGVVCQLATRGLSGGLGPVVAATRRAPRAALTAYLRDCRKLSLAGERSATQISLTMLIIMLLGIALAVIAGALLMVGYWGLW